MNVRNCRKCGTIFNYVAGLPICPNCKSKMEEEFQKVKKYIEDNKGVGIPQVAKACEVDPSQIRQWVREERLEFAEGSGMGFECESCGAPILTGRFCEKCKVEMINGMKGAMKKPEAPKQQPKDVRDNPRMRFLEH